MRSQLQASRGRPQYIGVLGINHSISILASDMQPKLCKIGSKFKAYHQFSRSSDMEDEKKDHPVIEKTIHLKVNAWRSIKKFINNNWHWTNDEVLTQPDEPSARGVLHRDG